MTTLNLQRISKPRRKLKSDVLDKNYLLQFLPEILDGVSSEKHIQFNGQKLKSSYLIDIIHNLILKYYFKKENKFNLSSQILKEKYGHLYNYYIDWLLQKNIIQLLSKHRKGKNARVYCITESILRSSIKRFNNTDKVLLKKWRNKVTQSIVDDVESSLISTEVKIKLIEDLYSVQVEDYRAIFYLQSLRDGDIDIYNRNKYSVECINDGQIFYHFDAYGRMHTNFTILKSFIRKNCLLIDGLETCELDIKNSQPLFLSKLIESSRTKWVDDDELELFKQLTINGKYYNFMMEKFNCKEKDLIKESTYKVLFGRNSSNSNADKMFSQVFPTIHNFIKLYKKENGDYRVLAYELQKAESNLIFNKIIKHITQFNPEIKIITVHDSIIFPKKYEENVRAVFYTKLYEEFGLI